MNFIFIIIVGVLVYLILPEKSKPEADYYSIQDIKGIIERSMINPVYEKKINIMEEEKLREERKKLKEETNEYGRSLISNKRTSIGEELCRDLLQKAFDRPFESVRPNWLKNPKTHMNLELDCYNPELKLAIEYQGAQHYMPSKHFYGDNTDAFIDQSDRDDLKKKICKERGVTLIAVPYTVPREMIQGYLLDKLFKKGFGKHMIDEYKNLDDSPQENTYKKHEDNINEIYTIKRLRSGIMGSS